MASRGFKSVNDASTVQIDETYCNLQFIGKGRAENNGTTYPVIQVSVQAENPVMFLRPTAGLASIRRVASSGNMWTFFIGLASGVPYVDWYVFDNPRQSSEKYGIRVWRVDSGVRKLTYDSGNKYLRIVGVTPIGSFTPGSGIDVIGPAGYTLAVAFSEPGTLVEQLNQVGTNPIYRAPNEYGMSLSGATLRVQSYAVTFATYPPGATVTTKAVPPQLAIFADVTNL